MNTMLHISDFYDFCNTLLEQGATYVSIEEIQQLFKDKGHK